MSEKDTGGTAFPAHGTMGEIVEHGMSLRDYFAAKALSAVVGAIMPQECHRWSVADFADEAYKLADAMLAERAK